MHDAEVMTARQASRALVALGGLALLCACDRRGASGARADGGAPLARVSPPRPRVDFAAPADDSIPGGAEGDSIRLGRELATHTFERLPSNVGSALHCTSCHLAGGTTPNAGPWVGVTSIYPEYRSRAARAITIEERIDECFERSVNGSPLPRSSHEMRGLVAYMTWLSAGVPKGAEVIGRGFARLERPPNVDSDAGKHSYGARCATCHGLDGAGRQSPDGTYFVPPLWGPRSFNIGAGMARLDTAAAFVRQNMPLGQAEKLTTWESYEIAAYFTEQGRPDFPGKSSDWPRGGKPPDARY
jgi:thiosulfate dehydrogenase